MTDSAPTTPASARPADPALLGLIRSHGDLRADHMRAYREDADDADRLARQADELLARITAMLPAAADPDEAHALANLCLRAYTGQPPSYPGSRTPYVVVAIHGVSVAVQRRARDLYVHLDTSETEDKVVAVEINGGGEHDYALR
ncbi:MAG: hypothetical protein V7603_5057 [Micromonosporaceae bacterium]